MYSQPVGSQCHLTGTICMSDVWLNEQEVVTNGSFKSSYAYRPPTKQVLLVLALGWGLILLPKRSVLNSFLNMDVGASPSNYSGYQQLL